MQQHAHTLKTPLSNHGSHANRRTTVSYFFLKTSVSIWIRKFRANSTGKSDLTFLKKKLSPSIIAHFPHVWSNQYWGTPNGVPQIAFWPLTSIDNSSNSGSQPTRSRRKYTGWHPSLSIVLTCREWGGVTGEGTNLGWWKSVICWLPP